MFSRIKEAVRILSTKPTEPEVKPYFRISLYSGNGKCLLNVLVLGYCEYNEKEKNFWAEKPDGKVLEIFVGNDHTLIIEEVPKQDAPVRY